MNYELQTFETSIAGMPVGRLSLDDLVSDSLRDTVSDIAASWREEGVWLVACRVPEGDSSCISALEGAGFRSIETLVTLEHPLDRDIPDDQDVQFAKPNDTEQCVAVASAFTFDRLHRDGAVPDTIADAIRAQWVRNNLAGRSDGNFVIKLDGEIAGFNFCLLRDDKATIDLIAVSAQHQSMGLGRRLVDGALRHYKGRASRMRVGTQEKNIPSMALYQRCGFQEVRRQRTLHWINTEVGP